MKIPVIMTILSLALGACASTPQEPGARRSQIRDCPVGWVLICETAKAQEPSQGGDEEIPEYDRCTCEQVN